MKRILPAFLAVAVVLSIGYWFLGRDPHYTALFPDAAGITKGDDVRVAGINVGKVTEVKARGASVQVTFTTDRTLTKDTRTGVKIGSLLGDRYLQLKPGKGDRLSSGATIPLDQAEGSYTLDRFWMDATKVNGQLDLDTMSQAIDVLAKDLNTPAADTQQALQGLGELSTIAAKRSDQVDHLISSIQSVTAMVNDQMERIDQITTNADQIMVAVNKRHEALTELIRSTRQMIRQLNTLAATNDKPMHQALTRMRSVVETLVDHRKELDRTLQMAGPAMRLYTSSLGDGPWLGVNAPYFVLPDDFYCELGSAKGCQ
jgi:phospholipid/cholesterol/gamma-HCH transport system substrate-binding protein